MVVPVSVFECTRVCVWWVRNNLSPNKYKSLKAANSAVVHTHLLRLQIILLLY